MGDEAGVTLVMVVLVMAALAAGLTTVVTYGTTTDRTAVRASAEQQAYAYAEAGVNAAMATLHANETNALDPAALPAPPPDPAAERLDFDNGYALVGATLDTTTLKWHITSIGFAHNRSSPGLPDRTRTIEAASQVVPTLTQPLNNQVWNYIYARDAGGSNVCDVTILNNVTLSAPIYAEGNLCLNNNAHVTEPSTSPPTSVSVVVKGKVQISNNASVGQSSSRPISEAHVLGGCGSTLSNAHECTEDDDVYARTLDSEIPAIDPPSPDWSQWYEQASIGPNAPCGPGSIDPPTFDGPDGALDLATNGDAPTLDLTPPTAYTCKTQSGELSWDPTHRVLTVQGVIYVDGDVTVSNGQVNEYDGMATLYATGTFTMINNSMMCGKRNASGWDCDFDHATGWDPNEEMLIVVAHGADAYGNSVTLENNTKWEGGVYAENGISLVNNAVVEGPMILDSVVFTNNVTAKPFPLIEQVPAGAPGNPNVHAEAEPPTYLG